MFRPDNEIEFSCRADFGMGFHFVLGMAKLIQLSAESNCVISDNTNLNLLPVVSGLSSTRQP